MSIRVATVSQLINQLKLNYFSIIVITDYHLVVFEEKNLKHLSLSFSFSLSFMTVK